MIENSEVNHWNNEELNVAESGDCYQFPHEIHIRCLQNIHKSVLIKRILKFH